MHIIKFRGFISGVYVMLRFIRGERNKRAGFAGDHVIQIKAFTFLNNIKQKPVFSPAGSVDFATVFRKYVSTTDEFHTADLIFLFGVGVENHIITAIFLIFFSIKPIVMRLL